MSGIKRAKISGLQNYGTCSQWHSTGGGYSGGHETKILKDGTEHTTSWEKKPPMKKQLEDSQEAYKALLTKYQHLQDLFVRIFNEKKS